MEKVLIDSSDGFSTVIYYKRLSIKSTIVYSTAKYLGLYRNTDCLLLVF